MPELGREIGSKQRNHNIIEFLGTEGSFRNTTVGGRVTGESLDLGIVDDPIKGREEANSEVIRDKTWEWFTDDFMGCFSQRAALLVICTRYHVDDPVGRMIETMPNLKILRYPAFAERDEPHRKKGVPLFPELKSREFLEERRRVLTQAGFQSIYQQSPMIIGGGTFPIEKFKISKYVPLGDIKRSVRYIDKAATESGGAWTAGVLMHLLKDNTIFISDVRRGQWSSLKREQIIKQMVEIDYSQFKSYRVVVEQEPGSGGKESAESTIRNLIGYVVEADKVTGSKETRAEPYAAQVQAGNVSLLAAEWNRDYLNEAECVQAGTFVLTSMGAKAIENVRPDDLVWTRMGWRRVLRSGRTSRNARLCEISCSNGQQLRCTLNHPIWVQGSGFTSARFLTVGQRLLHITEGESSIFERLETISYRQCATPKKSCSTATCMNKRLGLFHLDFIFTTKMMTSITTLLKTWSACLIQITCASRARSTITNALCAVLGFGRSDSQELALSSVGTRTFGQRLNPFLGELAVNAVRNSSHCGPGKSSVASPVPRQIIGNLGALDINESKKNFASGAGSVSNLTLGALARRDSVLEPVVQRLRMLPGEHDVYNLTVDECPEYLANGILVHNCFPSGKYVDQVDASSGAFNKLTLGLQYDCSLSWVDGHGV